MPAKCEKQVLTRRNTGPQKMHAFFGEKAEKEALLSTARLPSATTIASVVLRERNRIFARRERRCPNFKHKKGIASDTKLATPRVQMKKPPTGAKGVPANACVCGEKPERRSERRRRTNCKRSLFVATPIAKPLRLTPQVCFADYRLCRTFGIKMPSRTIRSPRRRGGAGGIRTHVRVTPQTVFKFVRLFGTCRKTREIIGI